MQINMNEEVKARLVAKAREMLAGYDGKGEDTWDAVMLDDKDGYDINVYQENENEPLQVVAYEVKGLAVVNDYANWLDITEAVMADNACETCNGLGYVHTNNEQCDDEIQRCDDCQQFKSDADAKSSLKNTNLTRDNLKECASRLGYDLSDEDYDGMIANAYDGETASEVFTGFLNTFKR